MPKSGLQWPVLVCSSIRARLGTVDRLLSGKGRAQPEPDSETDTGRRKLSVVAPRVGTIDVVEVIYDSPKCEPRGSADGTGNECTLQSLLQSDAVDVAAFKHEFLATLPDGYGVLRETDEIAFCRFEFHVHYLHTLAHA